MESLCSAILRKQFGSFLRCLYPFSIPPPEPNLMSTARISPTECFPWPCFGSWGAMSIPAPNRDHPPNWWMLFCEKLTLAWIDSTDGVLLMTFPTGNSLPARNGSRLDKLTLSAAWTGALYHGNLALGMMSKPDSEGNLPKPAETGMMMRLIS